MKKSPVVKAAITLAVSAVCLGLLVRAQERDAVDPRDVNKLYKKSGYSPYAGRAYPTKVFWGDTHLHTSVSLDARAFGNLLGPEKAYRFARGEARRSTRPTCPKCTSARIL